MTFKVSTNKSPKRSTNKLFSKLSELTFEQVGRLNPQLLREWQGRLRWRNLIITGLLSFVIQSVLFFQRYTQLPVAYQGSHGYCLTTLENGKCLTNANNQPIINWPFLWADIFHDLSLVLVWGLIVGGVYLLAADLAKETRRGTLNFLRMSPQPGRQILIGKLLGVPILLYLGVGMLLPLHIAMGLMGSYPLSRLLTFYGLLAAVSFCFYAAALWFALMAKGLQGFQTWLIAGLSAGLLFMGWDLQHLGFSADWFHFFNPLHFLANWEVQGLGDKTTWPFLGQHLNGFRSLSWFIFPAGEALGFFVFSMLNALGLGLCFWAVLERKYQMPTSTLISKPQSYGITLWLSLIVAGLDLQNTQYSNMAWTYSFSMLFWSVLLLFLLLPSKQQLLDWTRYRHQQVRSSSARVFSWRSLWQHLPGADFLYHDGSPAVIAFAVNLGIIGGVFLMGHHLMGLGGDNSDYSPGTLDWAIISALLITCYLLVQWIALSNLLHWRWLAFGTVAAIVVGAPIVLMMLGINQYSAPGSFLWLATAFPHSVMDDGVGLGSLSAAIALHTALIASLSWVLSRRCQVLGQSEWKALMSKE